MKYKLMIAASAAVIGFASAAHAEPFYKAHGFYTSIAGGYNQTTDSDFDLGAASGEAEYDGGYAVLGAAGYSFYPGWRAELEGGYRKNSFDDAAGHTRAWSAMANVLYDIPTDWAPGFVSRFNPYIGAGIGAAWINTEGATPVATGVDDGSTEFAYQGIAGVDYAVTPQAKVGFSYRYFGTSDYDISTPAGTAEAEYQNHTFLVGLKYTFAQPERRVETRTETVQTRTESPVVRAEAPRVFQVFFAYDRSDLNAAAKRTIQEAAAQAKTKNPISLEVGGHADKSGNASYNDALSAKRANAVKAELVRNGLSDQDIMVRAFGEDDPLVQTPDGVKAAENRRAVIVLR